MAAVDPIVAISCPARERPFRRIPDVPVDLLELNSGADTSGKPGAVQLSDVADPAWSRQLSSISNIAKQPFADSLVLPLRIPSVRWLESLLALSLVFAGETAVSSRPLACNVGWNRSRAIQPRHHLD